MATRSTTIHFFAVILLLIASSCSFVQAQTPANISSLESWCIAKLQQARSDEAAENELAVYSFIVDTLLSSTRYQLAAQYAQESTNVWLTSTDSVLAGKHAFLIGEAYHYNSKFQLADQFFKKSFDLLEGHDPIARAEASYAQANNLVFMSRYDESLEASYRTLDLYIALKDSDEIAAAKDQIVVALSYLDENDRAKKLIAENQKYFASTGNKEALMISKLDLGYVYLAEEKYDSCDLIANAVYFYFLNQGDSEGVIIAASLLSSLRMEQERWEDALVYLEDIINEVGKVEDKRDLHLFHLDVGKIMTKLRRFDEALKNIALFKEIGDEVGEQDVAMNYHAAMRELYAEQSNYKLALYHAQLHDAAKDSVAEIKEQRSIQELNVRYELAEKERKIAAQELENRRLNSEFLLSEKDKELIRSNRNFWMIAIAALAILALLILNRRRLKQKQENALLQQAITHKNVELEQYTKSIVEKNELIERFEKELEELSKLHDVAEKEKQEKLEMLYQLKILTDDDWRQYQQLFRQVHPNFLSNLTDKYKDLTEGDKRFLMLLKLGMDPKQMAQILGVSQSSIRVSRHRLKKKLGVTDGEDLVV